MPETGAHELKLTILYPLVQYVSVHHGREALYTGAERAKIGIEELRKGRQWVSTDQAEAFCHYVDELVQGDEVAFRKACAFRLKGAYGPLRYILWATNPLTVVRQAAANMHLVSSCGHYKISERDRTHLELAYTSERAEGRHLCLLRQTNIITMPTFWGLPPARLEEAGCVGRGDDACTYHVHWTQPARRWPAFAGILAGGAGGAAMLAAGPAASWAWPSLLAVVGGGLGHLLELRRAGRDSLDFARESHQALERLAHDEAETCRQLAALTRRQQEWTSLTERQLTQRTTALEKVIKTVEKTQEDRVTALRGMSHDLRSPLSVLYAAAEYARLRGLSPGDSIIKEQTKAVERMDAMLRQLMDVALAETASAAPRRPAETINVAALTGQLRGQLRALVFGKDIRVSVFCSREAPAEIEADRLLFSRVLDNLLTNAAKYTDKGSILIELDGRPDFLTIKISDSGRGIPADALDQVFKAGGSEEGRRAPDSYGVGLSVVVRLLSEAGGRLEVMSKEDVGTTFWIFFPTRPLPDSSSVAQDEMPTASHAKVVRIRRDTEDATGALAKAP